MFLALDEVSIFAFLKKKTNFYSSTNMLCLWSVVFHCLTMFQLPLAARSWLDRQWKTTDQGLEYHSGEKVNPLNTDATFDRNISLSSAHFNFLNLCFICLKFEWWLQYGKLVTIIWSRSTTFLVMLWLTLYLEHEKEAVDSVWLQDWMT